MKIFQTLLIISLCLISVQTKNSNIIIEGYIKNLNTDEEVPYAFVLNLNDISYGTSANKEGYFRLSLPNRSDQDEIHFSSLGYYDTIINVSALQKGKNTVFLKEKPFQLDEVEVKPGEWKSGILGSKKGDFISRNNGISVMNAGISSATYVDLKGLSSILLDSVDIYIGNRNFDSPFTIRILEAESKQKPLRTSNTSEFNDILKSKLLLEPTKEGWFRIDLSEQLVQISSKGFYFSINQVYSGKKYDWQGKSIVSYLSQESDNSRYGHVIGLQRRQSPKIHEALLTGSKIGILEKENFHTAIVFYYSYKK